ncbi:MAG: ribosome-binding factor A [Candidatus Moraniibacteriota bacterium]|nr:MAG: ribosome-binding factor A [Candidatus Moranbacteria bacterium]
MSERIRKVNSVISQEMSQLIAQNIDFKPGVFVTISKVDTTDDLRYTRIFIRVFPQSDIDYGLKTMEHEKNTLQKILHKKLHLKILPKISFVHDTTGDEVDEIEKLLAQ